MFRLMYRVAGGRLLAVLAALAMAVGGAWAFRALPVDAFPDTSPSLVQVFTPTEGLAPEEVERYVTFPLKRAMFGLPKLEEIRSVSNFGLSILNIYFEDGTDVYFARQVVGERLGQAREAREAIPQGLGDPQMATSRAAPPIVFPVSVMFRSRSRDGGTGEDRQQECNARSSIASAPERNYILARPSPNSRCEHRKE